MKRLSACALSLALSVSMILPAGAAGAAFTDVPQDHWASPYVEAMTQKGVVTGVGNGRFNPDGNLSTAEFAVMLTQAFCPKEVADLVGALSECRLGGRLSHRHHRRIQLCRWELGRRCGDRPHDPVRHGPGHEQHRGGREDDPAHR